MRNTQYSKDLIWDIINEACLTMTKEIGHGQVGEEEIFSKELLERVKRYMEN